MTEGQSIPDPNPGKRKPFEVEAWEFPLYTRLSKKDTRLSEKEILEAMKKAEQVQVDVKQGTVILGVRSVELQKTIDEFLKYKNEFNALTKLRSDKSITDYMDAGVMGEFLNQGDRERNLKALMVFDKVGLVSIGNVLVDPQGNILCETFNKGKPSWPDKVTDHEGNEISSHGLDYVGCIKFETQPS